MPTVVTLSASFASGGSIIGPLVADRLGVPFLDRAIPVAVAEALAVPTAEALAHDERRSTGLGRALASLAKAASAPDTVFGAPTTTVPVPSADQPEHMFREQTEQVINDIAATSGGVILGRAGAIVLRDDPTALHVRLDGPVEGRIALAIAFEGVDDATARKRLGQTDRAREAYVKHFYKCDARDPRHYHLVIDSTVLDVDTCVQLIVLAARARNPSVPPASTA
jgi:cytidylate kinase